MEYLLRRNKKVLGVDFDPRVVEYWRGKKVPALYGDMTDPEMYEHLPLSKVQWVISSVRSKELNLSLINNLKHDNYKGKIAVSAISDQEVKEFKQAGANLVFSPFKDATERAVDALTYPMNFLPDNINWPVSLMEVRLKSDAATTGKTIKDIPLSEIGVSILAVSRGGLMYYEPEPDFRFFPADLILLVGPPEDLKEAEKILNQVEHQTDGNTSDHFEIAEIVVKKNSPFVGQTLEKLEFRQTYGVSVVGIRRVHETITKVPPSLRFLEGDCLIVLGKAERVEALKEKTKTL